MAQQPKRKAAPAAEATSTITSVAPTQTHVLVANQHTAPIIIPRATMQGEQRLALPPLILHPGVVTPIEGEEWNVRKQLVVIQHYLDRGLLAEVKQEGQCAMDPTSTDLSAAIPENLKSEEELGNTASAKVTKANVGSVEV